MATRASSKRTPKQPSAQKSSASAPQPAVPAKKRTAQAAAASPPTVVSEMTPVVSGPELKKRELLELVSERTGLQKNKIKPAVEAMLEVMGEAIAEGRSLNVPPFGKVKLVRGRDAGNATVTVAKIRQVKPSDA